MILHRVAKPASSGRRGYGTSRQRHRNRAAGYRAQQRFQDEKATRQWHIVDSRETAAGAACNKEADVARCKRGEAGNMLREKRAAFAGSDLATERRAHCDGYDLEEQMGDCLDRWHGWSGRDFAHCGSHADEFAVRPMHAIPPETCDDACTK